MGGESAAFFFDMTALNLIFVNNLTRPLEATARVQYCDSFLCRLRGLMFRSRLARDEGLLLVEKRDSRIDTSIHMFFVPFDLAVFWINSEMTVVDKIIAKSWRPAYFPGQEAKYTLELHPDRFGDYDIGDKVVFKNA
jgi:uncharacterized membrane protein (UPF0127 family)